MLFLNVDLLSKNCLTERLIQISIIFVISLAKPLEKLSVVYSVCF